MILIVRTKKVGPHSSVRFFDLGPQMPLLSQLRFYNEELTTTFNSETPHNSTFALLRYPQHFVPAMHRALNVYDIVHQIVSWLPETDLLVTIRVNKLWFSASKPFLWEDIYLCNALELLGPAETLDKPHHSSGDLSIDTSNWKRFSLYSCHVRVLRGKVTDSASLFHVIRSRLNLPGNSDENNYLFPACQSLYWDFAGTQVEIQNFSALIAPTVNCIDLFAEPKIRSVWFHKIFKMLAARLWSLRVLCIDYQRDSTKLGHLTSFHQLLKRFASTLSHIEMPRTLFTQTTMSRLSEIPNLDHLTTTGPKRSNTRDQETDYIVGNVSSRVLTFTSLTFLVFHPSIPQLSVFNFFRQASLTALTALYWYIEEVEIDVDFFLSRIPTVCPSLESLFFGELRAPKTHIVEWPLVRSLALNCKKLNVLSLCCLQVEMTLDNLVELLGCCDVSSGWFALKVFSVRPFHIMEALPLYAKYAQNIYCIGFHVHDKGGIQQFSGTPVATSLPLYLQEDNANSIRSYIEAHSQLTNNVRQSGIFLPCLQYITFGGSSFMLESVGTIASLLLAISEHPVYPISWDKEYVVKVHDHMVAFYAEKQILTTKLFSQKISYFMELCHKHKTDYLFD